MHINIITYIPPNNPSFLSRIKESSNFWNNVWLRLTFGISRATLLCRIEWYSSALLLPNGLGKLGLVSTPQSLKS